MKTTINAAGRLAPEHGTVTRAPPLRIGYFAQHQLDELNPDETPYEHVRELMRDQPEAKVRARVGGILQKRNFTEGAAVTKGQSLYSIDAAPFESALARFGGLAPDVCALAGKDILGARVYASLAEIPEPLDMVEVFRNSQAADGIVDEALALDPLPKVIWMQLSVRNDEAAARAEARGLTVIMNRCPKIEYGRLSGEIGWTGVNSRTLSAKKPLLAGDGVQRLGIAANIEFLYPGRFLARALGGASPALPGEADPWQLPALAWSVLSVLDGDTLDERGIDRIVDVFPAAEKDMVRAMLSESLRAVISQTLLKTKDGTSRVAAHEIMVGTPAIRNLIRENKVAQMYSAIQTGAQLGMQTLDQNLTDLVRRNVISKEEARNKAANKENFN